MTAFPRNAVRWMIRLTAAVILAMGPGTRSARAEGEAARGYQIKAVFLFNFVQFVRWPPSSLPGPGEPFQIGVLGESPFQSALDAALRGETFEGRPIRVQYSQRLADLGSCRILFVCASEKEHLAEILAATRSAPVLTVSEIPDFARRGGVINFYMDGNKVRFEINAAAAQRHGLKVSSQLLNLARVVSGPTVEER